jgi:histidyl-tRNA synthetase
VGLVAQLRQAGIRAELSYGGRSSKAQMKQANASGAAYALLLGENELAGDFITVKDLQVGGMEPEKKQVEVKRADLVEFLRRA